jgi:2-polyprenyl-3-methyl-5-hydroxy-6-metoxy-1,4-benzoquinol methylase
MAIDAPVEGRWNHNIAYHDVVVDALAPHAGAVLDVGCGEGTLARQLAPRAVSVTGIDLDAPSIELARSSTTAESVTFVEGDVLTHPLPTAGYDAVVSIATVHHVDLATVLARFDELTVPGGTIVVIGLARSDRPRDFALDASGSVTSRAIRLRRGWWDHPSPVVWPPPTTYDEVRSIAGDVLPGCDIRRRLLFRYSLIWHKPPRGLDRDAEGGSPPGERRQ